jgi:hypothetical protein
LLLQLRLDAPTELTTAATDLLLAVVCLWCAAYLGRESPRTARLQPWRLAFLLLAIAAVLGAFAHAFHVPDQFYRLIWAPIYLSLSLAVACFLLGVIYDALPGQMRALRPVVIVLALGCFATATALPKLFAVFLVWQGFAMLLAIAAYLYLWQSRRLAGSGWICIGLLISVAAALIQATRAVSFTLIWPFDHNGVFHLVQIPGLMAIAYGLTAPARRSRSAEAGAAG